MQEYFPHDFYASCDIRLRRLQLKLGLAALGLYWKTIEELYRSGNRLPPEAIEVLALENGVTDELMQGMLHDYGLFAFADDGSVYSAEVAEKIATIAEKQQQRKDAAAARWSKKDRQGAAECDRNAGGMRAECDRIAIKENKIKEKERVDTIVSTPKNSERKPQAALPPSEQEQGQAATMVAENALPVIADDTGRGAVELEDELRRLCADDSVKLLIARRTDFRPLDPQSLAALLAMVPEFAAQESLKCTNQRGKALALHFVNWLAKKTKIGSGRNSTPAEREQRYRDETERELLAGLYPEKKMRN